MGLLLGPAILFVGSGCLTVLVPEPRFYVHGSVTEFEIRYYDSANNGLSAEAPGLFCASM